VSFEIIPALCFKFANPPFFLLHKSWRKQPILAGICTYNIFLVLENIDVWKGTTNDRSTSGISEREILIS
jgi:hypothetical protein